MGHGLIDEKNNPNLWVNQLFEQKNTKNIALAGRNNHSIFINTLSELFFNDYDLVIVAWSIIPRFNFNINLETYETLTKLTDEFDININNNVTIEKKWLKQVGDSLLKIHHDHWDILYLICYLNALIKIHEVKNTSKQMFFVNTYSPWSDNFFEYKKLTEPNELGGYEKEFLDVETRGDNEIFELYDKIHVDYQNHGGIKTDHWLNLYSSFKKMKVDNASTIDTHPGLKSQQIYSKYLFNSLKSMLNDNNIKYLKPLL